MGPECVVRLDAAVHLLRASTAAFSSFLSALPERQAVSAQPGLWSPAAHVYHSALTIEVFAGVLAGTAPLAVFEGQSDFTDDAWHFAAPAPAAAPSILVPPPGVSRAEAIDRLAASAATLEAGIAALSPARAALCVRLPWATISLLQMCEWSAGHTLRHLAQAARELHQAGARALA